MLERQRKHLKNLQKQNKIEEFIVRALYIVIFLLYNAFEIWLVYLIGKYSNKVYELSMILVCFFVNKAIYGKPLHFRDNFLCLGVSLVLFYIAINIALTLQLSILFSVIIGVLCGCATSYIATYLYEENSKAKKRNLVQELVKLDLDIDKIQTICKKNGIDEEIGYIVDFRMNHSEDLTCYEFSIDASTLNRKINRFLRVAK